jgi:hypothetical protein
MRQSFTQDHAARSSRAQTCVQRRQERHKGCIAPWKKSSSKIMKKIPKVDFLFAVIVPWICES